MASAGPAFPSTKETTNYARLCRLLVDAGTQVLRETFDKFRPPGGLDTVLGSPPALPILQLLRKNKILNPSKWGKLFPAIKSKVTSKNFDITLLMVLFRNICGLTPPATGWNNLPLVTDLTPQADIARIKFYRNTVYGHASQASVDDVKFTTCWTDIRDTLVRLGGATYEAAIDDLKDECMDPDIEEHYKELLKQWKVDEDSIKDKLDQVVEKLDELKASCERRSTTATANFLLVNTIENIEQNGVVINVYNLSGFSQMGQTAGRSEEMFIVPVAQEQVGQTAGVEGSVSGHMRENQQECPTELNLWNVILSFKKPLNLFFQYLKRNLNVVVRRHDLGSLLITVECSSLQTLEGLWKDYTSGHLNKMAQETFVTAEVLEKLGLTGIKLKTFISEKEYENGKQIFMQSLVLPEQSPVLDGKSADACKSQVELQDTAPGSIVGELATTTELKELPQRETYSEATQQLLGMKRVHSEKFGQGPASTPSESNELQCINAMFLCDEWMSSRGGLSTFNREFAISLAKTASDKIIVHCYVSRSNDLDREDARNNGVNLITAKSIPGASDPLDWLKIPPQELSHPDIVIGHGRKFGTPAYCIVQTTNCKWVQFVHVFCEDLGKYKQTDENRSSVSDTIEENEKKHKSEIELCKAADVVVAVGSRLQQKYSRCLPDVKVHVITPGILEKFTDLSDQIGLNKVTHYPEEFSIFVFGRGTYEDLALKGYDIVAGAIGSLGEKFKMTFVGSPEGQHRNIEDWFLQKTRITRRQVTIRGYCDQDELKRMFHEADLVALPSRTEGFGLVALEAISAGVPILVTNESGIAKALKQVTGGASVIVESENPDEWSQKILQLSEQKPEERRDTSIRLRENYHKTYSWNNQCEKFKEIMQDLTARPSHTAGSNDSARGSLKLVKEMPSFLADFKSSIANVANWGDTKAADNDGNKEKGPPVENKDWNLLHSAAEGGDVSIIETILSRGFDVNSRDSWGTTPLMVAAAKGEVQAVDFLLLKGADLSLTTNIGRNLLHAAAEGGNVTIVKRMFSHNIPIDSSDNDGITSLMIAASNNDLQIVEFLLGNGADPLLENMRGNNAFFIASDYGSIAVIERLLSCGFNIDSRDGDGYTALMHAAACAKIQAVNYLLEKGADPSLTGTKNGWSLLHFSSQGGSVTLILSSLVDLTLILKIILV